MEKDKKIVAAISAVMSYVKQEEEVLRVQAASAGKANLAPQVAANIYGVSGRQSIMQTRNMMQMKAFHGVKTR